MSGEADDRTLADGSPPASPDDLFRRLDELGVDYTTVEHRAVFTVEEARAHRGELAGSHTKNLFLRNKKGRMWLVVCPESRAVDLKELAARLGAGRLSFGSPRRLMQNLGVIPGAVTPFGVINDKQGAVQVALDRRVLEAEPLNFHPLNNAMTTSIGKDGFLKFLSAEGHEPQLLDLD